MWPLTRTAYICICVNNLFLMQAQSYIYLSVNIHYTKFGIQKIWYQNYRNVTLEIVDQRNFVLNYIYQIVALHTFAHN